MAPGLQRSCLRSSHWLCPYPLEQFPECGLGIVCDRGAMVKAEDGKAQVHHAAHTGSRRGGIGMKGWRDKLDFAFPVHQQIRTKEHARLAGKEEPIVYLLRPWHVDRLYAARQEILGVIPDIGGFFHRLYPCRRIDFGAELLAVPPGRALMTLRGEADRHDRLEAAQRLLRKR